MKKSLPAFFSGRTYGIAVLFALLVLGLAAPAMAQTRVAFLGFSNDGGDPRYDYLSGFMGGIVEYDLSSQSGATLVERSALDQVLREQEVALALSDDQAVKVASIVNAQYLVKGGYTVMGAEVAITLTAIDVTTAKAIVFAERGSSENAIHGLVERLVQKISGKQVSLRSDEHDRSLLSLTDEKPGSIYLHTQLIGAEILLDGKFSGYSTGDITIPFKMDAIDPGTHRVSIKLRGFGVVKLPEVTFADWESSLQVKPGKTTVIKADARHLGTVLEEITELLDETVNLKPDDPEKTAQKSWDLSYTDRAGKKVAAKLAVTVTRDASGGTIAGILTTDSKDAPVTLECLSGKRETADFRAGDISLHLEIDLHADYRSDFTFRAGRDDLKGVRVPN